MTFGEKLKKYRKERGMTQKELAASSGIHYNTIVNYETGKSYPHNRNTYAILADLLEVQVDQLRNEEDDFVSSASEKYGYKGQKEAKALLDGFSGLMAGGELSEADKDAVMKAMQEIYWDCKADNAKKYSKSGKGGL